MATVKTFIGNIKGPKGDTGAAGTRGSRWTNGTAITGTSTTETIFSGSGITDALVNDMYLNTDTGNTYCCTAAGTASVAKWIYTEKITAFDDTKLPLTGGTLTGNLAIEGARLEVGKNDGAGVIDFHSGSTFVDYDTRILAHSGTGSNGGGGLIITANSGVVVNGGINTTGEITAPSFSGTATYAKKLHTSTGFVTSLETEGYGVFNGDNGTLITGVRGVLPIENGGTGNTTGLAATAMKATQDSVGQQINTTYIKDISVSTSNVMTVTKGDNGKELIELGGATYTGTNPITVDNTANTITHNKLFSSDISFDNLLATMYSGQSVSLRNIRCNAYGHITGSDYQTLSLRNTFIWSGWATTISGLSVSSSFQQNSDVTFIAHARGSYKNDINIYIEETYQLAFIFKLRWKSEVSTPTSSSVSSSDAYGTLGSTQYVYASNKVNGTGSEYSAVLSITHSSSGIFSLTLQDCSNGYIYLSSLQVIN